ncbi:hypothetical protein SLEP1_g24099 [Rubroshorea leprosula]|uniref:Uncharacterized protein n=1 Tax=Rubroshorea leprosula TaxID=152421 RepID=A0AAV5JN80_9ROSI|nr:hypothetical protein SLEP1_g24099 [Rubroshorea leprosula]
MEDLSCVKKTEGEIPHSQVTETMPNSEIDGSSSSGSRPNTDRYLDGAQPLERENAQPAIPGIDSIPTQSDKDKSDNDAESTDDWLSYLDLSLLEDDFESCHPCSESMEDKSLSSSSHPDTVDKFLSDSDAKEHSQNRAESKVLTE